MDGTYEGKSERDLLIELYVKFEEMEKDINELKEAFKEYKDDKKSKIAEIETSIKELQAWKSERMGSQKALVVAASVLGFLGGLIANVIIEYLI